MGQFECHASSCAKARRGRRNGPPFGRRQAERAHQVGVRAELAVGQGSAQHYLIKLHTKPHELELELLELRGLPVSESRGSNSIWAPTPKWLNNGRLRPINPAPGLLSARPN